MSTVEAIQCDLDGIYILWPGTPEDPPKYIYDEELHRENPRQFTELNPLGPVFKYHHRLSTLCWVLAETQTQTQQTEIGR